MNIFHRSTNTIPIAVCVGIVNLWMIPFACGQLNLADPELISTLSGVNLATSVSNDGLELYYSSWWEPGKWVITRAQRESKTATWQSLGTVEELQTEFPTRNDRVALSPDNLTMIFSSDRHGGTGGFDLYQSTRSDRNSEWQSPTNLKSLNTNLNEGSPYFSNDGNTLYFSGVLFEPSTLSRTSWDVSSESWTDVEIVPGFEDLRSVSYPSLSPDGLTIVYAAQDDIWRATRADLDSPFVDHGLIDELNTSQIDHFPFLTTDGELYYVPNAVGGGDWNLHKTGEELIHPRFDVNRDGGADFDDIERMCRNLLRTRLDEAWDLNQDGEVNLDDFLLTIDHFDVPVGDANLDRQVNLSDFLLLSENFGTQPRERWASGDFNCDKTVGFDDFLRLSSNFGTNNVATVPEPCNIVLMLPMLLIFHFNRKERP